MGFEERLIEVELLDVTLLFVMGAASGAAFECCSIKGISESEDEDRWNTGRDLDNGTSEENLDSFREGFVFWELISHVSYNDLYT